MSKNDNIRILIADPSFDDRERLRILLNIGGYYDLIFAEDMLNAFEVLGLTEARKANDISLILMDIFAQNTDGIRWLELIKTIEHIKDIPFIIVTENTTLEDMLSSFEIGAQDYIIKPVKDKIELIARVNSAVRVKMEMDVRKAKEKELIRTAQLLDESNKQLKEANEHLAAIASLDALTGVANRRYFDDYAEKEWRRAQRMRAPVSLLIMDIDYFKLYNDTYGHQRGDECLKQFATVLKNVFKRPLDLPARYGGEEFIAIMPETDIAGAIAITGDLYNKVSQLEITHEQSAISKVVTFSTGIASTIPGHGAVLEDLISCADKALYKAKSDGRSRYAVYNKNST